jgi:hypothetical protein
MPGYFLDTSALVKHYHPEAGSAEVDRLWNDPRAALFIPRLAALEIASAFAGMVRGGVITPAESDVLTRRFSADVTAKRLAVIRLLVLHFKEAERLLRPNALSARFRTSAAMMPQPPYGFASLSGSRCSSSPARLRPRLAEQAGPARQRLPGRFPPAVARDDLAKPPVPFTRRPPRAVHASSP